MIFELETTPDTAPLANGLTLMQRSAGDRTINWDQDTNTFARELLLARDAGYLTWNDQTGRNVGVTNPLSDSNYWLQQIWELRLTLAGRDRARGREVLRPLPDPEEDDDRPIAGMTLEEIARVIGGTYTGVQLPKYLRESGVPPEFIPLEVDGSKWAYVLDVFDRLHEGGSAARRTLREFIGGWVEGQHHVAPEPEVRTRIVTLLGNQGWHVRDGRLVVGEKTYSTAVPLVPLGGDSRIATLHVDVRRVADRYLTSGHLEVAIFEAFKAVTNRVKTMTGLDLDGSTLIGQAFSESHPAIVLDDLDTDTGRNVQAGYRFLFMGAVRAIRNPDAHEQFKELDAAEALEMLAFASMLMRRLDLAKVALREE